MTPSSWWRAAAIYELYVQSFADSDGDGIGDLAGVRARLPYLAELGVDAIWFSPWYPSPRSDAGYDVADYRSIDPAFGTLADADALIAEGHGHGIRTIIDIVPNHCSDQHRWFAAALAAPPGSAERDRFWFRPGRGEHGDLPPNDWQSIFGGPAWTRTDRPGRHAGGVVPAPVRARAARLQLGQPRGPGRVRGHPAVLVRPRRRRHPDRLRRPADQGPGAAGLRTRATRRPTPTATTCTTSTGPGARSPTNTPAGY